MVDSFMREVFTLIDKEKIGKQLKELRLARGWRQVEIADKVGLSRSAISNIEAGKRALTLVTLKKFCEIYQIDVSYFEIETDNYNEALDLTSRLEAIFSSDQIEESKKDELYREIMKIYLKNKE